MYADDMVFFSESVEGLQAMLDTLYNYTEKWKLSVNINKTKIVVFRNGGILSRLTLFAKNYV
jgi:negative regulator of genetic competence, sporulation and motility